MGRKASVTWDAERSAAAGSIPDPPETTDSVNTPPSRTYADRREYMRTYQREWVARRRAGWFADKTCSRCGSTGELEIHHLDPETKVANAIWSWSEQRRDAELAKCVILCSACHHDHHAEGARARHQEIKRLFAEGARQTDIARQLDVSATLVSLVVRDKPL